MIIPLQDGKSFVLSSFSDGSKKDPNAEELARYITEVERQIKKFSEDRLEISARYLLLSSASIQMGFDVLGGHYLRKAKECSPNISKQEKLSILSADSFDFHANIITEAFPGVIECWGMIE